MKKLATLLIVSVLGGVFTLGSYKLFLEEEQISSSLPLPSTEERSDFIPANYTERNYGTNADFTEAAENTVHAVVHVKNVAVFKGTRNPFEFYYGGRSNSEGKAVQGAGSGVIITPDGYIVTNNHVIEGASELEVTLNNNKTYTAEVVGTDKASDIALLKVDAEGLNYIPFGNSNNVRLGEWVLAVGNPFNLKSTVTAGIVSAKARDLNTADIIPQSFIQTDAAINPGNSGGALVNINGELIGINTAITSKTGSYVGYAFAVPSNNARKIVEDIMEFGHVQQGILGIRGGSLTPQVVKELNLEATQGVYVADVSPGSGAENAGIRENDIIRKIDNIQINKFSDLTGYINSKHPNDEVSVTLLRDGREREVKVILTKYEAYTIKSIGLEVANASKEELRSYNTEYGVKINQILRNDLPAEELAGNIITEINNEKVRNIQDVERVIEGKRSSDPIVVTFIDENGEKQRVVWR
ncbi:trypsin-like peptidase domain-containing protein [Salegentibacter sp. F188]|uniref:Trypsin-like peptidase domain-containing protein n=1 Tax=Autumnicola patrickiae TaxID=3075591 RepID=A0ABU3DX85_9FLAO|nr:trypsin-like peptidase domain-containing protein [Salegentibacter sp. F188]MDT0688308.1 trypsin-like peptidase domain-containing protein [Salegentibacter sp. F188]